MNGDDSRRNLRSRQRVSGYMRQICGALLSLVLAGCATAVPTATPTGTPAVSHTADPSHELVMRCVGTQTYDCAGAKRSALAAVAALGLPVESVEIYSYGWPCGSPFFSSASPPPGCPVGPGGPTAYVTFIGSEKVAALEFAIAKDGSVTATVLAFRVPPPVGDMPS